MDLRFRVFSKVQLTGNTRTDTWMVEYSDTPLCCRHFYEANKNMQNYHRLFQVSQERYDKLVNLASSGGASSIKVSMRFDSQPRP